MKMYASDKKAYVGREYLGHYGAALDEARKAAGPVVMEFISSGVGTDITRWTPEQCNKFIAAIVDSYVCAVDEVVYDDGVPF